MSSLVGQRLGDYQLEAELGRGSMGAVYRATHIGQGKSCAVKVLLDALASDTSFVTRFKREANIAATLRHPNIVRVFDAGIQGEHIFFAMEYFEGMTAGRLLKQRKQFTPPQVVEMAVQASDALAYAHVEGHVVHRDIKPENLMVDRWWRTKVLDFGLARVEGLHSITSAGTVVGSLYYVSPEQLLGQKIDGRSDVYALGVSMYEMLSGQRPHRGQTFSELSNSILSGKYQPLREALPGVAPQLERIVARAMARELADRYESAADLWRDLRAFQTSSGAPGNGNDAGTSSTGRAASRGADWRPTAPPTSFPAAGKPAANLHQRLGPRLASGVGRRITLRPIFRKIGILRRPHVYSTYTSCVDTSAGAHCRRLTLVANRLRISKSNIEAGAAKMAQQTQTPGGQKKSSGAAPPATGGVNGFLGGLRSFFRHRRRQLAP